MVSLTVYDSGADMAGGFMPCCTAYATKSPPLTSGLLSQECCASTVKVMYKPGVCLALAVSIREIDGWQELMQIGGQVLAEEAIVSGN